VLIGFMTYIQGAESAAQPPPNDSTASFHHGKIPWLVKGTGCC